MFAVFSFVGAKMQSLARVFASRVANDGGTTESLNCINPSYLLSQASFLQIPSGYKAGVAYAELPANGNGDLTWSRASSATRTLASGTIETPRTNHIRNSSMVGASTSPSTLPTNWIATLAGLTQTVVGIGTENGLPYVDVQFSGTATGSSSVLRFESATQIVASNGQTWTSSFWIKEIAAPTPPNSYQNYIQERDSGGAILTTGTQTITISATLTRDIFTRTNTNASTGRINNAVGGNLTIGNTYDFTIRIAAPQLELGFQVTDWIPTTTSARTTFAGITQDGLSASNIPRLDYTYGSCPALLLEPQRTNSIRNSTMQGAVAGSPGTLPTNWTINTGVTQTIVGSGVENGLPYLDVRFNGTASTSLILLSSESTSGIAALNGQTWTNSFYFKAIASPLPPTSYNVHTIQRASGTNIGSFNLPFTPTSTLARYTQTVTTNQATITHIQPFFFASVNSGQTYDFTIRIAAPQMELGAFATTWINTTNAAATRLVDTFSRNNIYTNGLISASGGTWFVELRNNVAYTRDASGTLGLFTSTVSTTYGFVIKTGTGTLQRLLIAKRVANVETPLYATLTDTIKVAIKWNGATADIFVNGTKQISATAFTDTVMEGILAQTLDVPKFIQAMALWPTPISDADCEVLTGTSYSSYSAMATALGYTIL